MSDLSKKGRGIYQDPGEIDSSLWSELQSKNVSEVCAHASVRYDEIQGCYQVPFLHQTYGCYPESRLIECFGDDGSKRLSFQFYLVLLTYLLRAQPIGLTGRMVTGSEIKGGDFFFRGPHALSPGHWKNGSVMMLKPFLKLGCASAGERLISVMSLFGCGLYQKFPLATFFGWEMKSFQQEW